MSASHKRRLARLWASMPPPAQAEGRAVERREELRWQAMLCAFIRRAMERRGIDPAEAAMLCAYEASFAGFIDTPELQAADAAFRAAHPDDDGETEKEDPREWLLAELDRIAERFIDGSSPDFAICSMSQLWAWAMVQARLARADPAAENPAAAGEGSGA
jgi:hypothetical protein